MNIHLFILIITQLCFVYPQCGKPAFKPSIKHKTLNRIINGNFSIANSWPWMSSIRYINDSNEILHYCGGVLISPYHVITAAHCVRTDKKLLAILGSNNLNDKLNSSNIFKISSVYIHPNYDAFLRRNDLAILKLKRKVFFNRKISPICLPRNDEVNVIFNKSVVVTGWGSSDGMNNRKALTNSLTQAVLTVYNYQNKDHCKNYDSINYCAYDSLNSANICFGDSGGPLMFYQNDKWVLYGITNFMLNDPLTLKCHNTLPSFYVMIPRFNNWIRDTIRL